MEDLSGQLPGGPVNALVPTSQSDGGEPHDNSHAMTAPGMAPPLEVVRIPGETDTHPAPDVSAIGHDRTTVQPEGTRDVSPWRGADGGPWVDASPDISGGNARPGPWGQQ